MSIEVIESVCGRNLTMSCPADCPLHNLGKTIANEEEAENGSNWVRKMIAMRKKGIPYAFHEQSRIIKKYTELLTSCKRYSHKNPPR